MWAKQICIVASRRVQHWWPALSRTPNQHTDFHVSHVLYCPRIASAGNGHSYLRVTVAHAQNLVCGHSLPRQHLQQWWTVGANLRNLESGLRGKCIIWQFLSFWGQFVFWLDHVRQVKSESKRDEVVMQRWQQVGGGGDPDCLYRSFQNC